MHHNPKPLTPVSEPVTSSITCHRWHPRHAGDFDRINRQWIESMFVLEASDIEMLEHPERVIINDGGMIWLAAHPELGIVGTVALHRESEGVYELTKMGVLEHARGLKVGEQLLDHMLNDLGDFPIDELFLLTNRRCAPAIHLYEKAGFEHDADIMQRYAAHYDRCNVAMKYSGIRNSG